MKQHVLDLIKESISNLGYEEEVELTDPKGHGDYSTNIALKCAKKYERTPMIIGHKIAEELMLFNKTISRVAVVAPGFINIFLKKDSIKEIVEEIYSNPNFGSLKQKKKINIEYVSANPTGFLHIGHARNAAVGSALVNILRFAGNKVDAEYYINDAGNQIELLGKSLFARYKELEGEKLELPTDGYMGEDIIEGAKKFKDKFKDKYKNAKYEDVKEEFENHGKDIFLEIIKEHLKMYNVTFDIFSSEKSLYKSGQIKKTLEKIKNYTEEKDGAIWLKTEEKGDDKNRVLIKSDKTYTYFTPDISYHDMKLSRGYDELINIWGADHIGYIKRMEIALQYLGLPSDKLHILTIQLVSLTEDDKTLKMSKRTGTTYTLVELIEEIGVDAARWYMLDRSFNSPFSFEINQAKNKTNDNPVFLVQYTHARMNQLINKSKKQPNPGEYNEKEKDLINYLNRFPEFIEKITETHKIHLLTQYLLDLCNMFNSWYSNTKAIGSEDEESSIALVYASKSVLKKGLELLGINAPNKM